MCSQKVTQVSNKGCGVLFEGSKERSRASIKGRLFEGSIGLKRGSIVYFVQGEDCWEGVQHRLIKRTIVGL